MVEPLGTFGVGVLLQPHDCHVSNPLFLCYFLMSMSIAFSFQIKESALHELFLFLSEFVSHCGWNCV